MKDQKKNNIKTRGLKEGIEGEDLESFSTDLFTSWVGADCEVVIRILSSYHVGVFKSSAKFPRDVIVKFLYWSTKVKILECYWEQPNLVIEGSSVFPDLSAITLQKRKGFEFLTQYLQTWGILYHWGFPL